MQHVHALPISVRTEPLARLDADLLAVPVFEDDELVQIDGLDAATGGELSRVAGTRELARKRFEYVISPFVPGRYAARRVLFVSAGPRAAFDADTARTVAALAASVARQRFAPRLILVLRGGGGGQSPTREPLRVVQAAAEGLVLPQLETATHKTAAPERVRLESIGIACVGFDASEQDLAQAVERGRIVGEATNHTRALANQPGNVLTPSAFAAAAQSLAADTDLHIDVLDQDQIEAARMGLLLGVARGSAEPPRVVVLRHGATNGSGPVLGLIGKGITFDTGGISIKPADGMERMKADMAGGAAVIAAMCAIAKLRLPARVIGIVPCTENMPGGRAMKPGDVLTSAAGKTVEVVNTDAEGRLVLGDALWYARSLGATHLVDIATLTGACAVALGKQASALFAHPDEWSLAVRQAGELAGDRLWPMPLFEEYLEQLRSESADWMNTGGRLAGAITAALFLKQFAGDGPWAHLDIAGTSWIDEPKPWQAKGASGVGTRTLVELARNFAAAAAPQ
jgi:leucyl aminopeptidase